MEPMLSCLFCASDNLAVTELDGGDNPVVLAVRCEECGATGPLSDDPAHAIFAWNQRMGRLSVVR